MTVLVGSLWERESCLFIHVFEALLLSSEPTTTPLHPPYAQALTSVLDHDKMGYLECLLFETTPPPDLTGVNLVF